MLLSFPISVQCFLPIMLFGHYVVSVPWDDSYKGFPTKGPNLVFGLPCRSQTCHPQPCHICHGLGLARDTKENMCREAVRVNLFFWVYARRVRHSSNIGRQASVRSGQACTPVAGPFEGAGAKCTICPQLLFTCGRN